MSYFSAMSLSVSPGCTMYMISAGGSSASVCPARASPSRRAGVWAAESSTLRPPRSHRLRLCRCKTINSGTADDRTTARCGPACRRFSRCIPAAERASACRWAWPWRAAWPWADDRAGGGARDGRRQRRDGRRLARGLNDNGHEYKHGDGREDDDEDARGALRRFDALLSLDGFGLRCFGFGNGHQVRAAVHARLGARRDRRIALRAQTLLFGGGTLGRGVQPRALARAWKLHLTKLPSRLRVGAIACIACSTTLMCSSSGTPRSTAACSISVAIHAGCKGLVLPLFLDAGSDRHRRCSCWAAPARWP